MSAPRTWLCPTEADRRRLLDMDLRIGPTRRLVMITLAGALLAAGPWLGFWTLAPLAVAAVAFAIADHDIELARHPEYRAAASWGISQACIAVSAALTGGPGSPRRRLAGHPGRDPRRPVQPGRHGRAARLHGRAHGRGHRRR